MTHLAKAKRQGFDWIMVHSGPDPLYQWQCSECRKPFAERLKKPNPHIAAARAKVEEIKQTIRQQSAVTTPWPLITKIDDLATAALKELDECQ